MPIPHPFRPVRRGVAALSAVLLSLGAMTAGQPAASAAEPALVSQDLAAAGSGSPYYRIPALAVSTKGTVLAAYDARPTLGDLPSNIHMVLRRSTDNGTTWRDQQIVRQDPAPHGYGDPSFVVDRQTGRIFLFYAAGQNQGYIGGTTGNDPNDPNVLQADYSYSDDDGLTWQHRRITPQIKDPAWGGMFAASGAGIQIKRGPYAGRLVQQYSIRYQGKNWAGSAYSDDHGDTWHMGALTGPGTDENKSVELEDGRLMLNSRATPNRLVAYSSDGGESWQGLHADPNLIDPGDNGSILRYNADAAPGTQQASWLLFSNNESTSSRSNLVVKQSCDNGQTWPIRKVVEPGFAAYSTLTRLPDGSFGLLWESKDYTRITFSKFDRDWLGGVCAPLSVTAPRDATAGGSINVAVKVTSQQAGNLNGTVTLTDLPSGWSAGTVRVPRLRDGQSATVSVPLTVPSGTSANGYPIRAVYTTSQGRSTTPNPTQIVVRGGNTVWNDSTERQVPYVNHRPAATLLSSADPISQVRDLVVSLNSGAPYVEFRTASSTYPIRIQSAVNAADGNDHELIFASSNGISTLILAGPPQPHHRRQPRLRNPTSHLDQPLALHRHHPLDQHHHLTGNAEDLY